MKPKVLFIDDEPDFLRALESYFKYDFEVETADSGEKGLSLIDQTQYDAVVTDMSMPAGKSGLDVIMEVRRTDPILPIIIMTGVGTIENAVEAIQQGAFHYITKPFASKDLEITVRRAIETGQLHRQLARNRSDSSKDSYVLGSSRRIQEIMQTIDKVSESDAPILLLGETGTGKSMIAKHIHDKSSRKGKPLFTIDCAALAETLLESELFGHVKGAFTGAVSAKRGLLEEAHGGTVLLDEIGDLTLSTQVKLLRAVQEHEIKPVGGNRPVHIDVRFISATSRNLEAEIENKKFRKDLYFRLAVIPLILPPLRERKFDIPLFATHFLQKFNRKYNKIVTRLEPSVIQQLQNSPWKGNIRELENCMERAVLLASGEVVTRDLLYGSNQTLQCSLEASTDRYPSLKEVVEEAESLAIQQMLEVTDGNRTQTAKRLGIGRRTLYDKMEFYNIH